MGLAELLLGATNSALHLSYLLFQGFDLALLLAADGGHLLLELFVLLPKREGATYPANFLGLLQVTRSLGAAALPCILQSLLFVEARPDILSGLGLVIKHCACRVNVRSCLSYLLEALDLGPLLWLRADSGILHLR